MAGVSKTVRPKRSSNRLVLPSGFGLTAGRGTPVVSGVSGGGGYYNDHVSISTREPVNANTLLAEDFYRGGVGGWYSKHCDDANGSGGLSQAGVEGWCGTIYAPSGLLTANPGAVVQLASGEWAGTSGNKTSGSTGLMADRALTRAVTEIWVRFYMKPLTGYTFGAEKLLTFNDGAPGGAGIKWGNWSWRCGGSAGSSGNLTMGFPAPEDVCNQLNYTITAGTWHFIQIHMKLSTNSSTANGEYRMWADGCGSGTLPVNPGGSPTLRFTRTNVRNAWASASDRIRVLWFEHWSNPESIGTVYTRSIYASDGGPIGFASNP